MSEQTKTRQKVFNNIKPYQEDVTLKNIVQVVIFIILINNPDIFRQKAFFS